MKKEIKNYYNTHYKTIEDNTEGLFDEVTKEFKELVDIQFNNLNKNALDLGYGYGNYSIYLAKSCYKVDAVDVVDSIWLKQRIKDNKELEDHINIISTDIIEFEFLKKYNIIFCKDVLHYLHISDLKKVLYRIAEHTDEDAIVFIVIFTNIVRRDRTGKILKFDEEANLDYNLWRDILYSTFNSWNIEIESEEYREREKFNKNYQYYFEAKRVSCVLKKPGTQLLKKRLGV